MTVVDNLGNLRANVNPASVSVVYVRAHTYSDDKGGGFFMWNGNDPFKSGNGSDYSIDNDGTIIISDLNATGGAWTRIYDGLINVNFFGASGLGADYTTAIQKAIDFAYLNAINDTGTTLYKQAYMNSSTVYIPSGAYGITNVTIKDGVSIVGDVQNKPLINAGSGATGDFVFEIDNGPVRTNISNLALAGNDTLRGGFLFEAKFDSGNVHGGLWNSTIKNISITGFQGHAIYLKGGGVDGNVDSDFKLPNQQNVFENIFVERKNFNGNALKMSGQNGQISFLDCIFDGFYNESTNTWIGGHNVNIENDNQYISSLISFRNTGIQSSDYGIVINWGENIQLDNCWFENTGVAITVNNVVRGANDHPSRSVTIENCRFANASGFGSLVAPNNIKAGNCISVSKSYVTISDCYTTVSDPQGSNLNPDSFFLRVADHDMGGVALNNNGFQAPNLNKTFGVIQGLDFDITTSTLKSYGHQRIYANYQAPTFLVPQPKISIIESEMGAGEFLVIRANNGPVSFAKTGNIHFNASSPSTLLTIQNGEVATFVKMDQIYNGYTAFYQVTSIFRRA